MSEQQYKATEIGVKCMACSLHFTIWSWYSDRHKASTIYCPECGQHEGKFLIYKGDGTLLIFTKVPGNLPLVEVMGHEFIPSTRE